MPCPASRGAPFARCRPDSGSDFGADDEPGGAGGQHDQHHRARQGFGRCHWHLRADASTGIRVPRHRFRRRRRLPDCYQRSRIADHARQRTSRDVGDRHSRRGSAVAGSGSAGARRRRRDGSGAAQDRRRAIASAQARRLRQRQGRAERAVYRVSDRQRARPVCGNPPGHGRRHFADRDSAAYGRTTRSASLPSPDDGGVSRAPTRRDRLSRQQRQPGL